jgi:hypothetical protein
MRKGSWAIFQAVTARTITMHGKRKPGVCRKELVERHGGSHTPPTARFRQGGTVGSRSSETRSKEHAGMSAMNGPGDIHQSHAAIEQERRIQSERVL